MALKKMDMPKDLRHRKWTDEQWQKAKEWHDNFFENLKNLELPLNDDETSDIIIIHYDAPLYQMTYTNQATGKYSLKLEDVVRPGKRFIFVKENEPNIDGIKVFAFEDIDVFAVVEATLKNGIWHETNRGFLSRNFPSHGRLRNNAIAVDICGQAIVPEYSEEYVQYAICNAYVGAKEKALKYFNGPLLKNGRFIENEWLNFNYQNDFFTVFCALSEDKPYIVDYCVEIERVITMTKESSGYETPARSCLHFTKLPKEANDAINSFAKMFINSASLRARKTSNIPKSVGICIFQNIKDDAVYMENYMLNFYYDFPISKTRFEFFEVQDVAVCNKDKVFHMPICGQYYPVWVGDMTDTLFEYSRYLIDDWIEITSQNKEFRDLIDECSDKYACDPCCLPEVAVYIGQYPLLEKLLKVDCEKAWDFRRDIFTKLTYNLSYEDYSSVDDMLEKTFGHSDMSKSKLHQMLGIPKGGLEFIIDNYLFLSNVIGLIKRYFNGSEAAKKYLANMNIEEFQTLAEILYNVDTCGYDGEDFGDLISSIIALKGPENWRLYLDAMPDIIDHDEQDFYKDYIQALVNLGEAAKDYPWNITGEELEKKFELLAPTLNETKYKKETEIFEKKRNNWKELTYKDKKFSVQYPDNPSDIIKEGAKLHHCAADFIYDVAMGKTTLLFIREVRNPDKPYFTLEIKNNKVRQCHGACNKSVEEDSELDKFLHEYCKTKRIEYHIGNVLLGV